MSKVCLNHPETPATDRCSACFKPLCDDCVLLYKGQSYCSEECITQASRTVDNIEKFKASEKRFLFKRMIVKVFKFIIFLLILLVVLYFLMKKGIIKF